MSETSAQDQGDHALADLQARAHDLAIPADAIVATRALITHLTDARDFQAACTWHAHLRELERRDFDRARDTQLQALESEHDIASKHHAAALERLRTEELEALVAERTDELRARNRELLAARDAAATASQAKSTFLAIASHELRTPLNAVIGYTELLLDELDGGLDPHLFLTDLDNILRSSRHLLTMIERILTLSRLESGDISPTPQTLDPHALLDRICRDADPRGNTLHVDLDALPSDPMRSDVDALTQITSHLLDNALRFTRQGTITVHAARARDLLELEIRDTGAGIGLATLGRIFEPFEQEDLSFTRLHEGLGLGLPLCKRYCELLGGDLQATSTLGVGTSFLVHIPWRMP